MSNLSYCHNAASQSRGEHAAARPRPPCPAPRAAASDSEKVERSWGGTCPVGRQKEEGKRHKRREKKGGPQQCIRHLSLTPAWLPRARTGRPQHRTPEARCGAPLVLQPQRHHTFMGNGGRGRRRHWRRPPPSRASPPHLIGMRWRPDADGRRATPVLLPDVTAGAVRSGQQQHCCPVGGCAGRRRSCPSPRNAPRRGLAMAWRSRSGADLSEETYASTKLISPFRHVAQQTESIFNKKITQTINMFFLSAQHFLCWTQACRPRREVAPLPCGHFTGSVERLVWWRQPRCGAGAAGGGEGSWAAAPPASPAPPPSRRRWGGDLPPGAPPGLAPPPLPAGPWPWPQPPRASARGGG